MKSYLLLAVAALLVLAGCENSQPQRLTLRPPIGKAAERFGTDREGTVNFHIARLSIALDAEHEKAVELAGRMRKLEASSIWDIDPNELKLIVSRPETVVIEPNIPACLFEKMAPNGEKCKDLPPHEHY